MAKEIVESVDKKIIDQIRSIGIDMIDTANSGHPGVVLGAAPIIYTLYARHLRISPQNPNYFNRDRFILSAGHGSALLYATLFMAGYDITIDDLKDFRKIDSITPGHPEYGKTPGVDMTTGPLGQGIATAVGIAMAEAQLREKFGNKKLIDYNTYVLCGDGDLMEGVSYEAMSLAGTLKLNKLIVLYDSNDITLDGSTTLTFKEDIRKRVESMNWNYIKVLDGENYDDISKAIEHAKSSDLPTLIEVKTTIGKYSMLEGTSLVHGSPLSKVDITNVKEKLNQRDIPFAVSQNLQAEFTEMINGRCKDLEANFNKNLSALAEDEIFEINKFINNDFKININDFMYEAPIDLEESPRDTSNKILSYVAKNNNIVVGGSADLFAANKTYISEAGDFSADNYLGKNIFFGVREAAMGAILNGLALCGFRPYGSTFLTFSDYMRSQMRLACMLNLPIIYILTHDSISVGEDGPTHQPIEQLVSLRSMPNLDVFRPADANEVIGSYKAILEENAGPSVIALSRNKLPILQESNASNVSLGAYIAFDTNRKPDGIILSAGEEVHQSIQVAKNLRVKGLEVRVVSVPNLNRFLKQPKEYIDELLPVEVRKIVVEASSSFSWNSLIFDKKYLITLDQFGASGKKDDVYKKFGFDVESLEVKIEELLK